MPPLPVLQTMLIESRPITPTVKHLVFQFPDGVRFQFAPGQFVNILLEKDGKPYKRSYSVASPASLQDRLEFCIIRVDGGFASNHLMDMPVGSPVRVQGPYGKFLLKDPPEKGILFIATGTGIAPYRPMLARLIDQGHTRPARVYLGVRYENEILYQEEFDALSKRHPWLSYHAIISRAGADWKGERGHVQQAVLRDIPEGDRAGRDVYLCGATRNVLDIKQTLVAEGFEESRMHFELYG